MLKKNLSGKADEHRTWKIRNQKEKIQSVFEDFNGTVKLGDSEWLDSDWTSSDSPFYNNQFSS